MYCANCGVRLADTEKTCPLCGVAAYHPDLPRSNGAPLYPAGRQAQPQMNSKTALVVISTLFLIVAVTIIICDIKVSGMRLWSGYVSGALGVAYVIAVLPLWFKKPNPVIFVPCGFAAVALYLLYINFETGGSWFLSFAFPVTGGICLIVSAVVTLLRYVRKGSLYVFGGALMALGAFMPLVEFLICITFSGREFGVWFYYPLTVLGMLGGMLIFLAINQNLRESMERKFFI